VAWTVKKDIFRIKAVKDFKQARRQNLSSKCSYYILQWGKHIAVGLLSYTNRDTQRN